MKKLILITCSMVFIFWELNAQFLSDSEVSELKALAKNINIDADFSQGNWNAVINAIGDNHIVSIGEFNHGSNEVFLARNDLIKTLHKELGFNVILFESGIGEVGIAELEKKERSAKAMTYGFFSGWRNKAFEDLMEYVKIENIAIGGFDVQRTGGAFKDFLKVEVMKYEIDTSLAVTLEDRFLHAKNLLTNRKTKYDDIQKEINALINDYKIVLKLLKQKSELDDALKITDQTILNRVLYLNYMLDFVEEKDWNKRWAARDMAMAKNVLWLIDNFYKEDKILIIGHNFHISKSNENEETMGEVLDKQYELDMFVIGVFAGEGSYSGNYGSPVTMLQADSTRLDIKHIISQLKDQIYFIQIPKVKNSANKWMFEKIVVNDTFIDLSRTNEMNLSKHFDGLLLIDKVSPAVTK